MVREARGAEYEWLGGRHLLTDVERWETRRTRTEWNTASGDRTRCRRCSPV